MKADMRSRVGFFRSLMYSGMKREGKSGPRAERIRPVVGAGGGLVEQWVGADGDQRLGCEEERQTVGVGGLREVDAVGRLAGRRA